MNPEIIVQLINAALSLTAVLQAHNIDMSALNRAFQKAQDDGVPFDPQPFLDAAQAKIDAI